MNPFVPDDVTRHDAVRQAVPPGPPDAHNWRSGFIALLVSILAIVSVLIAVDRFTNHPAPSEATALIPWLDATPAPTEEPEAQPTIDPASDPPCTADDLAMFAGGWGGATGSLAGGATLINTSAQPCRVGGKPIVELVSKDGRRVVKSSRPDAEPGPPVALEPGGTVGVITVWSNWCGAQPVRPLTLQLELPDGAGTLVAPIHIWEGTGNGTETPRCDTPTEPSTVGVPEPFAPSSPAEGGGDSEACQAADLAGYLGGWGAGLGTSYASVVVLNIGGVPCRLATSPSLELRDADRTLLLTGERWPEPDSTVVMPAGWTATTTIGFADWCVARPKLPLSFDLLIGAKQLQLTPTSERSAIEPPGCNSTPGHAPPNLAYTGPFTVPGTPEPPEPDVIETLPIRVAASNLSATRAGETLVYSVTLTNTSPFGKPLELGDPCPFYTERLFLPDSRLSIDRRLVLNCAPVDALGQEPVTFEMRLPIPSGAPSGTATLVWELGDRGPAFKAAFDIIP